MGEVTVGEVRPLSKLDRGVKVPLVLLNPYESDEDIEDNASLGVGC